MMSIRSRLLLWSLIAGPLVVLLGGVVAYMLIRGRLIEQFDRSLVTEAETIALTIEQERDRLELLFLHYELLRLQADDAPNEATFVHLRENKGKTLYRSGSLRAMHLPGHERPAEEGTSDAWWCELPGGRGRAVTLLFSPATVYYEDESGNLIEPLTDLEWEEEWGWIEADREAARSDKEYQPLLDSPIRVGQEPETLVLVVGRRLDEVNATLADLRRLLLAVGLLATGASLAGSVVGVRRGLRSIDRVSESIQEVRPADLSARVPGRVPRELSPMVEQINMMLSRLERGFAREREFSADVAHELRTPLAGLQMKLDVALLGEREPERLRRDIADCLVITQGLEQVVADLLAAARMDARQARANAQRLPLLDQIEAALLPVRQQIQTRDIQLVVNVSTQQSVHIDPALLRIVLHNLIGNAVSYVNAGGMIEIAATDRQNKQARLVISNSGNPLSREELEQATRRFWRKSKSREEAGEHAGLGLSLVASAVEAMGGTLTLEARDGGVFAAVVDLPSA